MSSVPKSLSDPARPSCIYNSTMQHVSQSLTANAIATVYLTRRAWLDARPAEERYVERAARTEAWAVRRAARIFFYIGIIFAVLIVLHIIIVLACRQMGLSEPPKVLQFPRLELWLALALLQPFGQACGRALPTLLT